MTAILIDGKAAAAAEKERIAAEVGRLAEHGVVPGLAAVLVGDDPASHVYVDGKERDCVAVGMNSLGARLPADITQEELHAELDRLNANPEVSGIIVQLPLPGHLDPIAAQERTDPAQGRRRPAPGQRRPARARRPGCSCRRRRWAARCCSSATTSPPAARRS